MASKSAAALLVSETNLARGSVSPSRSHSRAFRGTAQTALASRSHSRAFRCVQGNRTDCTCLPFTLACVQGNRTDCTCRDRACKILEASSPSDLRSHM